MLSTRNTLLSFAVVLLVLCFATAASGGPNGRFKVGGHRLYLTCTGKGKPIVVLDQGLGLASEDWPAAMRRASALHTRVCAYDRYGLGRSSVGSLTSTKVRTIDQSVSDLHSLMRAAKLKSPYVFVGYATGGLIDREYARRYPEDVAGMVQLDAAADDWDTYTGAETFTAGYETLNFAAASAALRAYDSIGAKPLIVLEAGNDDRVRFVYASDKSAADFQAYWDSSQRSLALISHNSIFIVAPASEHDVPDTATSLSVEAMRLVVNAARTHGNLPLCQTTKLPSLGAKC